MHTAQHKFSQPQSVAEPTWCMLSNELFDLIRFKVFFFENHCHMGLNVFGMMSLYLFVAVHSLYKVGERCTPIPTRRQSDVWA